MLRHVLVPLDGSNLSEQALPYAQAITAKGGKITLVSVIELPIDYEYAVMDIPLTIVSNSTYNEEQYENTYRRVQEYLNIKARELTACGFDVECIVETGDPATVVSDVAERESVNAIAITTHGRTGFSKWLFGSVTQKVIATMPCPVFVVPGKEVVKSEEAQPVFRTAHATS